MEHLSLTGKRWEPRGNGGVIDAIAALPQTLMQERGLQAGTLLKGAQFADMERLRARIERAIADDETIGIFGDYDCDGITATALWVRFLRRRNNEPHVLLPHRIKDGYGIRAGHVDQMASKGVELLLTVDTGITAHDSVERANGQGIDVCIIDHHHAPGAPPAAHAIAHQDRAQAIDAPPSAATISFALIDALEGEAWADRDTDIALAAIGTVADVMPLIGSNRRLVADGCAAIARIRDGGLRELLDASGIKGACTARDMAFGIAPRLNAAGRMQDPVVALQALLEGGDAVRAICSLNRERQEHVEELLQELDARLGISDMARHSALPPFITVLSPTYSPGIVGLLAGRITERTGRPSLVGAVNGDRVTASLRSTPHYHLAEGLTRIAAHLDHFGGHAQAAGCAFPLAKAGDIERLLIADTAKRIAADRLGPAAFYDVTMRSVSDLSTESVRAISALEPFGSGNPEPRVLLKGVRLADVRKIGSDLTHLQARIDGVAAVGFGLGHLLEHTKDPLDVLCRLALNTWNGRTTPQVIVEDVRVTRR